MSYSKIILKLLEENPHRKFKSHELTKISTPYGWVGSSGDRRARNLAEKGLVEHDIDEEGYAIYWHKPKVVVPRQLAII